MLINNNPFDAHAASKRPVAGRFRGRRLRNLIVGGATLGVAGFIGLQTWLFGFGEDTANANVPTMPRKAEAPTFKFEEPPRREEKPPLPEPVVEQQKPRPQGQRKNEGPTQIAFAVQPQGEPDMAWFADGRRPHLAHGCALRPGASTIPAALETTVKSEIGGQAIATVTADVFDTDGVGRLLIPAGSKVVGQYKTE